MTKKEQIIWENDYYKKWDKEAVAGENFESTGRNIGGFRVNGKIDSILVCQYFQRVLILEKEKWTKEIIEKYGSYDNGCGCCSGTTLEIELTKKVI